MRRYAAEAVGTFALVFAGTGAIMIDDISHAVTHVGVAITFGLIVMSMIYAVGDISGAHLNPAVTLGFWLSRRLPPRTWLDLSFVERRDRKTVLYFDQLPSGSSSYSVLARVTTGGNFRWPASTVAPMYDLRSSGQSPAADIRVAGDR